MSKENFKSIDSSHVLFLTFNGIRKFLQWLESLVKSHQNHLSPLSDLAFPISERRRSGHSSRSIEQIARAGKQREGRLQSTIKLSDVY